MLGAVWVVAAVGVMWAVRARGGPGTHWQPYSPNTYKRVGGEGAGGSGPALAAKYSLNTYKNG